MNLKQNYWKIQLKEEWEKFPKQKGQEILSNKNEETLSTQCVQQLLRSSCSWVDFNFGCQVRGMLGFPRAVLENLLFSVLSLW